MGKTQDKGGLLETVEESQDEVPNAKSIGTRELESNRTSQQPKRDMENGEGAEPDLFKENNSQVRIYVHA